MRFCKDIANMLFCELWEWLTIPIKSQSLNMQETFMLICMHKINFINNVFLKILQRNTNLVTLSLFGRAWPHTSKVISTWRNLWYFFAGKKSTSSFTFPLSFCKNIENLLFWALWTYLTIHTQSDTINWCVKLLCFSADKNSNFIPTFFWRYCKYMQ